jgi:hypothetical protein
MVTRSKKCPKCGKTDEVVPILYGYPTQEAWEQEKAGKIYLGGCMEEIGAPQLYCKRCDNEFGRRKEIWEDL